MYGVIELVLSSALLWILLESAWIALVSIVYYVCVPWVVWGTLIVLIGLKLARISPPELSIVTEVLGADPLYMRRDNYSSDDNGNGEQYCMRVVAHRGAGFDYPENSMTALRNTREKGCTAVEIDLSLTKDNVPIIFHDFTIERLTGQTGSIKDMTWDELKELDIAYNHPLRRKFQGVEKIALFYDVVEECLFHGQRMIIDVKDSKWEICQVVADAFKKYPEMYKMAVVSSFNPLIVYSIRRKDPKIVSAIAWRPQLFSRMSYQALDGLGPVWYNNLFLHLGACTMEALYEWVFTRFIYYVVGVSAVLLHKDIVNPRVIQEWHERGIRVIAWTVNLPSEKSHFSRLLRITYLTDTLLAERVV